SRFHAQSSRHAGGSRGSYSRSAWLNRAAASGWEERIMNRPVYEMSDVIRAFGGGFEERYGHTLASVQRRAMRDIVRCRTAALGGGGQPIGAGCRCETSRCRGRILGGAAHLGTGAHSAPARSLRRAGRRPVSRRRALGVLPAGILVAGSTAEPIVPREVPGRA